MKELVKELSVVRDNFSSVKGAYDLALSEFYKQHDNELEIISEIKEQEKTLMDSIRELALEEFSKNGEKKLYGGIGIRVGKDKTMYNYDEGEALSFAKEKGMFLKLDVGPFESAIESLDLDFVSKEVVAGKATVTFPKDIVVD